MCNILLSCAMCIRLRVDKKLQFLPYRVKAVADFLVRWSTTISPRGREHHQPVEKVLRTNKGYLLIEHVGSEKTAYSNQAKGAQAHQASKFLAHRMI
jgi:hypothetical protein